MSVLRGLTTLGLRVGKVAFIWRHNERFTSIFWRHKVRCRCYECGPFLFTW